MIDCAFRTGSNYYPQVFFEEFKYVVPEKKSPGFITGNIEISSDSDKKNSDKNYKNASITNKNSYTYIYIYIYTL